MNVRNTVFKRGVLVTLCVVFGLAVAGCGKKPGKVKSPDESTSFPTQYPTSR